MVHVADRRLHVRSEAIVPVLAFTNAARARLTVNGVPQGEAVARNHVVRWPAVKLAMGENVITVRVTAKGRPLSDTVRWVRVAPSALGVSPTPAVEKPRRQEGTEAPPGQ